MQTSKPRAGIIVSEIDKYIVSFFFDDNKRLAVVSEDEIRRAGGRFSR